MSRQTGMVGEREVFMNITYSMEGDYLIPNIFANEEPEQALTKYGMLRKSFLKNNHKGIYTGKLLAGTLKASIYRNRQKIWQNSSQSS